MRAALLCVLAAGCTPVLSFGNQLFHTVSYRRDGFTVKDIRREFTYDADRNLERIRLEERVTYIDEGCDGIVEEIRGEGGTWRKGEPGTGTLFIEADSKFNAVRTYLHAEGYKEGWKAMTQEEIVRAANLDPRE
ncbi:MAG: hypothetical protein L0216_09740 [Planctomycetales bacterium]|nr:hypothetical protein [Planctomycetales bacterium]